MTEPTLPPTPVVPVGPARPAEWLSPGVLVPAYVLLVTLGFVAFARGWCTTPGNEFSRPQSVMCAVNAATLTGFQQARNPSDYTPPGQVLTLLLMAGGTWFSLVAGGMAVTRIARLPYRDGTLAIGALAAVVASAAVGLIAFDGDLFPRLFQGVSAFGNVGLFVGKLPAVTGWRAKAVLLPLAAVGGLGLPVLFDFGRGRPSPYAWRALTTTAAVYLLTFAALAAAGTVGPWVAREEWSWPIVADTAKAAVRTASWAAVDARSAGFPFQYVTALPAAVGVVLLLPMLVGGCPGGTAGGLKVTTLSALGGGLGDVVRRRPTSRAFGVAVAWVTVYVGVVGLTWASLVVTEPDKRPDRLLFLAVSAVGNVGWSYDPVTASTGGLWILSAAMAAGRLLPVAVLWWVVDRMPEVTEPIG